MPSETSPAAESNKAHFTLDDALKLYRLRLPECNVDLEPDDAEERPSTGSRIRCKRRSSVDFLGDLVAQSRTLALTKDERVGLSTECAAPSFSSLIRLSISPKDWARRGDASFEIDDSAP